MSELLGMLLGGDLRSEGRAAEVAGVVAEDPQLLLELVAGLESEDRLVRARTCMALEVLSRTHPVLVETIGARLVAVAAAETVPQARWHLAEVFANIELPPQEIDPVVTTLLAYLDDRSKIVVHTAVLALGRHGPASELGDDARARLAGLSGGSKGFRRAVEHALDRLAQRP